MCHLGGAWKRPLLHSMFAGVAWGWGWNCLKARLLTILEAGLERPRQLRVEVAGDPRAALPVSLRSAIQSLWHIWSTLNIFLLLLNTQRCSDCLCPLTVVIRLVCFASNAIRYIRDEDRNLSISISPGPSQVPCIEQAFNICQLQCVCRYVLYYYAPLQ